MNNWRQVLSWAGADYVPRSTVYPGSNAWEMLKELYNKGSFTNEELYGVKRENLDLDEGMHNLREGGWSKKLINTLVAEDLAYRSAGGLNITNFGKEHYEKYSQKYESKAQQRLQTINEHISRIIINIQNYVENILYSMEEKEKSAHISIVVSGEKPLYIYFETNINIEKLKKGVVDISPYTSLLINGIPKLYENEYYKKIKQGILNALRNLPASFYLSKLEGV
jgi:hypothetical protein